ncbi:MAG: N-acetylmuramoyl-L-alanine amidase [Candidatus Dormibacteria bacterium]
MCPWATRLVHVLVSAPVLAASAIASGPVSHAQEGGREQAAPAPLVVALDAGHGGAPDDSRPGTPFDSGAVGLRGLLEKDLTLDIAQRVRQQLAADLVQVVMTREDDRFVSVEDRSRLAQEGGASLFVSVHLNSWTDPSVGGSLVLYPGPRSAPFATAMAAALQRGLAPLGVENKGTELRDDWWIHTPMPVVTVEGAYLTNPQEAALLATPDFRQSLAHAIRDGLESFEPAIAQRRAAIKAWNATHRAGAVPADGDQKAASRSGGAGRLFSGLLWVFLLSCGGAALWHRRRLVTFLATVRERYEALRLGWPLDDRAYHWRSPMRRRHPATKVPGVSRPHSVYDDLWF